MKHATQFGDMVYEDKGQFVIDMEDGSPLDPQGSLEDAKDLVTRYYDSLHAESEDLTQVEWKEINDKPHCIWCKSETHVFHSENDEKDEPILSCKRCGFQTTWIEAWWGEPSKHTLLTSEQVDANITKEIAEQQKEEDDEYPDP